MKYKNRGAAPAHLLTKTELKRQRLKPGANQHAAAYYWQGHGYVTLYDPTEAIPMRPRREPTPEQLAALAAGRSLVGTSPCLWCGKRADNFELDNSGRCHDCVLASERKEWEQEIRAVHACAADWLHQSPLFLDAETTGLDSKAEIIEIAILDAAGVVLLDTLVKPCELIPEDATAVNGITDQDVANAPTWPEVSERVAGILVDRLVIAHNADFDSRMLRQTCLRHGLAMPTFKPDCTMALLTEMNGGRWPDLGAAASLAGAALPNGQRHRAKDDADLCRRIVLALARNTNSNSKRVSILNA